MAISDLIYLETDELRRDYIMPKSIVFASEGVINAENLLRSKRVQVHNGVGEQTVFSTENGKKAIVVLDFGSEFTGGARILGLAQSEPDGVKMRLRFGESVSEAMMPLGKKGANNDHSTRDMQICLKKSSDMQFAQTGYRFLYLELEEKEAHVKLMSVLGVFTYRDIPYRGKFECDDPLLNKIYNVSAYTCHLNMQGLLWDGVKRDRLVWIGDMHPEVLTILSVFGHNKIVDDSLRHVAEAFPSPNYPNHMTTYGMWYFLILWDWYLHNGNKHLVSELSGHWKPLLRQLCGLVQDEGGKALIESDLQTGFFLDWPTRYSPEAEAGVYGLLSLALNAGGKLADLSGDIELSKLCSKKRILLRGEKLPHNRRKQVAAMMYLAEHLDGSQTSDILTDGNGRGMSTFMSYYILTAAAETAGMTPALNMLREYYGGMLSVGATTFWEDFDVDWLRPGASIEKPLVDGEYDIHGDNGKHCYVGLRHSLCHGWSSGPAPFLAEKALGVRIEEPGCRVLTLTPELGDLKWVKGIYPTPYGDVVIEHSKENGKVCTAYTAPKEIQIRGALK